MNKEESKISKIIPLRQATNEELMELITDLHIQNYLKEMENVRLHSIIKEVRELRKKISNCYYKDGFELDTPMLLEYIDEILDKENK